VDDHQAMIETVDPIATPEAYRQSLLGALGDDDPADAQATTVAALRATVETAGERMTVRPEPGEWSALEVIGHMVDSELTTSARVRWIVAEDRPDIVGYDQDLWVARLRHGEDSPEALVALFEALRNANLELWARSSIEDRARVGVHRERGPESYDLIFRLAAGHDRVHLAQARAAIESAHVIA
jgi:hypothetical protein